MERLFPRRTDFRRCGVALVTVIHRVLVLLVGCFASPEHPGVRTFLRRVHLSRGGCFVVGRGGGSVAGVVVVEAPANNAALHSPHYLALPMNPPRSGAVRAPR